MVDWMKFSKRKMLKFPLSLVLLLLYTLYEVSLASLEAAAEVPMRVISAIGSLLPANDDNIGLNVIHLAIVTITFSRPDDALL